MYDAALGALSIFLLDLVERFVGSFWCAWLEVYSCTVIKFAYTEQKLLTLRLGEAEGARASSVEIALFLVGVYLAVQVVEITIKCLF